MHNCNIKHKLNNRFKKINRKMEKRKIKQKKKEYKIKSITENNGLEFKRLYEL